MSASVKHKQDNAALLFLAALSLALLTVLTVWKLKQFKYRLINETGAAMFYGMLLGLTARWLWFEAHAENVESVCTCHGLNSTPRVLTVNTTTHEHCYRRVGKISQRCSLISAPHAVTMETFDPEVLFNLFLPPIIFHGAYTLNQRRFIENLGSVLTYAFLGTIISCMCIGACMYGFTRLMVLLGQAADGEFFLTDCLLFGAIMSATDPVSVLGLLSDLRVDLDLHTLLFGESVLNDAVAIVLTHAITTYDQTGAVFDPAAFLRSAGLFLGVLVGSILIGFIFTVITALLTKFTRLHENPLLETSVFFLLSWSSFLSAQAGGLSGIVAVLFCGLSQARYTVLNLSSEGRTRTKQLFEVFNFLGEIFIFGYMGYVLLTFPHHVFKAVFISGAFLSIFISRACNIYPLSFLLNLGRTNKIPCAFQHFMTLAGLRGAVAFSVAFSLAARDDSTEARRAILTTTLLLVAFTIWVLGSASDPVLRRLDIRVGVDADENPQDLSLEVATGRPDTTRGLWHRLDYKYLKPLLTHCGPPLTDSLPPCCGVVARLFSSPHVQEEQLFETEPEECTFDLEKTENQFKSAGGDCGSENQEDLVEGDLVEGDLGLGTVPAHIREA
ncbi:sodium/hydrogen exchanger 9 isoform X1 [Stegastes partitus]|uniref:Sodium/hydrogen exchanger n=1 Tax=Stegastes partitus TaxID=144197 RepID=A0A9Y4NB10_9TELE|nr:PREDICTED: sodium/hydrogen exchanger 9 isoform X1 [Stegastes partitus]